MSRPGSVTLVATLTVINGLFQIGAGIIQLSKGPTGPASLTTGWVGVGLGLIFLLLGAGLFRGSGAARIIVTIAFLINVITTGYGYIAGFAEPSQWYLAIPGVLSLIGLILLWTPASSAFFARR